MNTCRNCVLVTHGISIRVLLARYFRYSINQFAMLANPRICEMVLLGHDGVGKLQLEGRMQLELEKREDGETHAKGYQFHKRLQVLPPHVIQKSKI